MMVGRVKAMVRVRIQMAVRVRQGKISKQAGKGMIIRVTRQVKV